MSRKRFTLRGLASAPESDGLGAEGIHPALVALHEQTLLAAARRPRRRSWTGLGEAWSFAASPPVMAVTAYVLTAATVAGVRPWVWTAVHLVLAVVFPLLVVVAMRRRGEISDLELTRLDQRQSPLLLTFLVNGVSLWVMETAVAPAPLVRLTMAFAVLSLVVLLVSRSWKISVHCAGVAVAGTVLWQLYDAPLWLAAGVVGMAAARVALGRHTVAQTIAGAVLGCAVTLVFTT